MRAGDTPREDALAIVAGDHPNPFAFLGPHKLGDRIVWGLTYMMLDGLFGVLHR